MSPNLGMFDRLLRFVVGAALIIFPTANATTLSLNSIAVYVAAIVGGLLIATAVVRFCPLYRLFGIRSGGH